MTNIEAKANELYPVEIWKPVPGYEGSYEVSNIGNVVSFRRGKRKMLKLAIRKGYYKVVLGVDGVISQPYVHRLVLSAFVGVSDMQVDHINGNKLDNRVENLRYCTPRENASFSNHHDYYKKTSKYLGVFWNKKDKRWRSEIIVGGKAKHLGNFKSEEQASEAYQTALQNLNKINLVK